MIVYNTQNYWVFGLCPFSGIVSNIFMDRFERLALDSALWLRYIDDIFVVWPHGPEQIQNLRPSIQFTMDIVSDSVIPFLDVLVIRKEMTVATRFYRKPTHTG
jgi:hypothetical protein